MRVIVDFGRCDAHGSCVEECPEVFALDDEDNLHVLVAEPGEELRPQVEAAARMCPKAAIRIDEL